MSNQKQFKLYYFFDALCGWCYGFSPVLKQLHEKWKEEISFEVFSGGMVTGSQIGPIGEVAPYIKDAYKEVEQRTKIQFGKNFFQELDHGQLTFSSLEPAYAIVVAKKQFPEKHVAFASAIQEAIYFHGKSPTNEATYAELVKAFGEDEQKFSDSFQKEDTRHEAEKEFALTQKFSVRGFPTVIVEKNKQHFMVARGYQEFEDVDFALDKIFNDRLGNDS